LVDDWQWRYHTHLSKGRFKEERMPLDWKLVFQRALPYDAFLEKYATPDQRNRWLAVYNAASLTSAQRDLLASFRRRMPVLCLSGPWCGDCINGCPLFQRIAEAAPFIDLRFVNRVQNFDAPPGTPEPRPGTADDPDDIRSRPIGKILVKWGILSPERVEKALLVQEERKAAGLNIRIGDVMTDMGLISTVQRDDALAAQSGFGSIDAWDRAVAKELSVCGAPRVPMLLFLSEDWYECSRYGERPISVYREKARKKLESMEGASCPSGLMVPHESIINESIADWLVEFERVQWMLLTSPRLSKLHGEH
jgi:thiol-disulfide isomerase/thioredoxin